MCSELVWRKLLCNNKVVGLSSYYSLVDIKLLTSWWLQEDTMLLEQLVTRLHIKFLTKLVSEQYEKKAIWRPSWNVIVSMATVSRHILLKMTILISHLISFDNHCLNAHRTNSLLKCIAVELI